MALQEDIAVQAEFLVAHNPAYLLSLPSNLIALCRHFARSGVELPPLREVRSYGEALSQEVRDACRVQWGVPVTDTYSSQELGYLAIQCPTAERYHVMSELFLARDPRRGGPARVGRARRGGWSPPISTTTACPCSVTTSATTPRWGSRAPAGGGLPVLDRVVGRAPPSRTS